MRRLEGFWEGSKLKATYDELFSTPEIEELTLLQRLLAPNAMVRLTELPQQLVDAFVDVAGRSLTLQAKARNMTSGNRFGFIMGKEYNKDSFDLYLLTIRDEDEDIRGFFLLPTSLLYKHRFFPGQRKRIRGRTDRATQEAVEFQRMQKIRVFSMCGGIQLPGLKPTNRREVTPEQWEFMTEASAFYFEVDHAASPVKLRTASMKHKLLKTVREKPKDLSLTHVVELRDIAILPRTIYDAGVSACKATYVCGTKSLGYNGDHFFCQDAWVIKVSPTRSEVTPWNGFCRTGASPIEQLIYKFFPPMKYFFKRRYADLTYAEVVGKTNGYTMVPEEALALAEAYAKDGVDGAVQEMYDLKGPGCEALKKILKHDGFKGRKRPDILAEDKPKKQKTQTEATRAPSKRKRTQRDLNVVEYAPRRTNVKNGKAGAYK